MPYPVGHSTGESQLERTLKKKTAEPLAHWTLNLMPVQVRRRTPPGTRLRHPQPSGATEGTVPCAESALGHEGNFGGPRIDPSVFPCSGRLPRRMLSLTKTGAARLKMPWNMATMARDNAKMIDEKGDLHVTCILDGLDSLYWVSMTFQSLNAALCGLQQRQMESACAYYNRMVQITVILTERHGNRYRPGELVRMSKDCFYVGLLPKNRPMVVHLKDQPHTTLLDLLKALLEQEENDTLTCTRYPPSMSSRTSQPSKPVERYHRQPLPEKRNDGYTVCPAQLDTDSTEAAPEVDSTPLNDTFDALETWYNDGFLIGLCQAAEVSELQHGHCFNCQKEGHHWRQCKEPLSPELQEVSDQQDREHEDRKKKALNPRGGMGMKGGHTPIPLAGVSPALPQAPGAPAQ